MVLCPNKNSVEFKSWLNAGISIEDIHTEFVLNNYALPMYAEDFTKAITFPEISRQIAELKGIQSGVAKIKDLDKLAHVPMQAVGAYFKDTLYFAEEVTKKTISEEVFHNIMQKYADKETHATLLKAGKELLEQRLKKEGRSLPTYLKELQSELKLSNKNLENYAFEEEVAKDFVLYDITGGIVNHNRKINELTEKLSIFGSLASSIAKLYFDFIQSLKNLFNKKDDLETAFATIKSLQQVRSGQYDREYDNPSFMFVPIGTTGIGVSPYILQKFTSDVVATYNSIYPEKNVNQDTFEERVLNITKEFRLYYNQDYNADTATNIEKGLFYAPTVMKQVFETEGQTTKDQFLQNVAGSLKSLGYNVDKYNNLSELEDDNDSLEEEGSGEKYDKAANEWDVESLSLGLKNIILKAGRKIETNTNFQLTIAPEVDHIYSGLVRYSSKGLTTTDKFKRMVEFSTFEENESNKLLIQDYYLEKFVDGASYNGKAIKSTQEWVDTILSDSFDFSKVSVSNVVLAQELVILIKGLSLVSRGMKIMSFDFESSDFKFFNANTNGVAKRLAREYEGNFRRKVKDTTLEEFTEWRNSLEVETLEETIVALYKFLGVNLSKTVESKILEGDLNLSTNVSYLNYLANAISDSAKPLMNEAGTGSLETITKELIELQVTYTENLLENSYRNIEKKTIYEFQRPTPILNTLRGLNNVENLNKYLSGGLIDGQKDYFTDGYHSNNPIINFLSNLSVEDRASATETFAIDGMFTLPSSDREEVAFGDMDDRHFTAMSLNLLLKGAKQLSDSSWVFPTTMGQNEASNLIDFNYSPVYTSEDVKLLLNQELNRVAKAKDLMQNFIDFVFDEENKELVKDWEILKSDDNSVLITDDNLKNYFGENNIPLYSGYLSGKYIVDKENKIIPVLSKVKAFDITTNFNDLITREDLHTKNNDELIKTLTSNLNKILDIQLAKVKELDVISLLDAGFSKLDANHAAFNMTTNIDANIKKALLQSWLASTFTNQILVGDPMLAFKNDFRDLPKRRRTHNAAVLGVDIPFNVPSLGIYAKDKIKYLLTESTQEYILKSSKLQDVDDAQSYSSMAFNMLERFSKGQLTTANYNLYLKLQAGEELDADVIKKNSFYINSNKTVGAEGNQIIKHSTHTVTPSDVAIITSVEDLEELNNVYETHSFVAGKLTPKTSTVLNGYYVGYQLNGVEVINKLESLPNRQQAFKDFVILNGWVPGSELTFNAPIDIKVPVTASKGLKKNVLTISHEEYAQNPNYYIQELSAQNFGDQVANPQDHQSVIDPSQNQEVKINEISSTIAEVKSFISNQSLRNEFKLDLILKQFFGKEWKKKDLSKIQIESKDFFDGFYNSLKDSGGDNQKLDFLELKKELGRYTTKYNLNLPPIRKKYTEYLMKMFTKSLRHKVAGDSMVQVSKKGYELIKKLVLKDVIINGKTIKDFPTWETVEYAEYSADSNKVDLGDLSKLLYNGKEEIKNKRTQLTQVLLNAQKENPDKTIYYYDEVRFMKPYFKENTFEFYTSEAIMPRWYGNFKHIPNELRLQFGVRIPTQDKQSSIAIEWVSTMGPEKGNSIIVPKEIIYLSGSDFDIDKLFTQRNSGYFKNRIFNSYKNTFEDFTTYMFEETFFKTILKERKQDSLVFQKANSDLIEYKKELKSEDILPLNKLNQELKYLYSLKNKAQNARYEELKRLNLGQKLIDNKTELNSKLVDVLEVLDQAYNIDENYLLNSLSTEYLELELTKLELLESIDKNNKLADNLIYKNNSLFLESLKEGNNLNNQKINELKVQLEKRKTEFDLMDKKNEEIKKLQLNLFKEYDYPVSSVQYKKEFLDQGKSYSGYIDNNQLENSIKILSNKAFIEGSSPIYETPATVKKFEDIYKNYSITLDKKKIDLKEYQNKYWFDKSNPLVIYPFKDKITGESIFIKNPDNLQLFSLLSHAKYQKDVQAAKTGIGIMANANVLGIAALRWGLESKDQGIVFEGKSYKNFTFKTTNEERVFDAISSAISVVTDEAKESQLANHGISTRDLKVLSIMLLHGIALEDAFAFTNSASAKGFNTKLDRKKLTDSISNSDKFKTNDALIESLIGDYKLEDFDIKKEELLDQAQSLKYLALYSNMVSRYDELTNLVPIVKIKAGFTNNASDFQEVIAKINEIKQNTSKFYDFKKVVKNKEVKSILNIYSNIEQALKGQLAEMNEFYTGIKEELKSSITSRKQDYNNNINKYIDDFLLGEYLRQDSPALFQDPINLKEKIVESIRSISLADLKPNSLEYRIKAEAIKNINTIINIQDEIKLNAEGKLNAKTKDILSNSWLMLEVSTDPVIKNIAKDLFRYYFVKDAFQYAQGSLEPLFPSYKFEKLSKVYKKITEENHEHLKADFITKFVTLFETNRYLKNYKNGASEAFKIKSKENVIDKYDLRLVDPLIKNTQYSSITIKDKTLLAEHPLLIKIAGTTYQKTDDTYYPVMSDLDVVPIEKYSQFLNTIIKNPIVEEVKMKYTPENITKLKPNQVFVFGSNAEGIHGKGAALQAKQKFGAKQGQAEGLQGQSYTVITKKDWRVEKSSTLPEIGKGIQNMLLYAKANPELEFLVTKIGSSLAGYNTTEIKELFEKLKNFIPDNVILPQEYEVRFGIETKQDIPKQLESEVTTNGIYSQLGNKTQSKNVVIKPWNELKDATNSFIETGNFIPEYGAYESFSIISTRIKDSNKHFGNPFSHDPAGKTQGLIKTGTIKEAVEAYISWILNGEVIISDEILKSKKEDIKTKLKENLSEFKIDAFGSKAKSGFNIREQFALITKEFNSKQEGLEYIESFFETKKGIEKLKKYVTPFIPPYMEQATEDRREWIVNQLKSGKLKGKQIAYYKELGEPSHATALDYLINKYNWNQSVSEVTEESNIKSGVEELFNENPELASIGTQEQYSQYLDQIFPNSQVKDIVYHGSSQGKLNNIDFTKSNWQGNPFYVTSDKVYGASYGKNVTSFLINSNYVKKQVDAYAAAPYSKKELKEEIEELNSEKIKLFYIGESGLNIRSVNSKEEAENFIKRNSGWEIADSSIINERVKEIEKELKEPPYDTIQTNVEGGGDIIYAVFEPEQIHILSSKKDLEDFKKFKEKITSQPVASVEQPVQEVVDNKDESQENSCVAPF